MWIASLYWYLQNTKTTHIFPWSCKVYINVFFNCLGPYIVLAMSTRPSACLLVLYWLEMSTNIRNIDIESWSSTYRLLKWKATGRLWTIAWSAEMLRKQGKKFNSCTSLKFKAHMFWRHSSLQSSMWMPAHM